MGSLKHAWDEQTSVRRSRDTEEEAERYGYGSAVAYFEHNGTGEHSYWEPVLIDAWYRGWDKYLKEKRPNGSQ